MLLVIDVVDDPVITNADAIHTGVRPYDALGSVRARNVRKSFNSRGQSALYLWSNSPQAAFSGGQEANAIGHRRLLQTEFCFDGVPRGDSASAAEEFQFLDGLLRLLHIQEILDDRFKHRQ